MEMEKRLYEAALEGNVSTLRALIQEDALALDRVSVTTLHENPLHVAILRGHLEFARAVLSHNPKLASEPDSLGHTPLHVAAAKGHATIIRELFQVVGPTACLGRSKDGKTPLHLAVMKGRVEVVKELTRACPESTRMRLNRGETVLHLCVEYDNLEALQVLVDELLAENDSSNLLSARDDNGNTVLHLAALHKNLEIIKYLLTKPSIELNAINDTGLTALDLVENSPRDIQGLEVLNFLLQSNAQRGTELSSTPKKKVPTSIITREQNVSTRPRSKTKSWKRFFTSFSSTIKQLENLQGAIFLTSAIIVVMNIVPVLYIEINRPDVTADFSMTVFTLFPALTVMIILLSGLPLNNGLCAWLVVQLMYTSLGIMALYYVVPLIGDETGRYINYNTPIYVILVWFVFIMIASLLNLIRLIAWVVKNIKKCAKRKQLRARREIGSSNA